MASPKTPSFPTFYIAHGGGPCFFMDWSSIGPADTWKKMGDWLENFGARLGTKPKALLIVSAHWEEPEFTLLETPNPELLFDYSGFPKHTYELTYPAPSSPEFAARVRGLLEGAGIPVRSEHRRGYDHGVFVPFKLIYPDADIPIVQLSLKRGLDPRAHFELGRALAPLREEGVLIVGSGMSYHNLRELFHTEGANEDSDVFDAWLTQAVTDSDFARRERSLIDWEKAPRARLAHPREEHLIPLLVTLGAAHGEAATRVFNDRVMGATTSAFQFGKIPEKIRHAEGNEIDASSP